MSSIASSRIIFSSDIVSLEKIILELDVAWASTHSMIKYSDCSSKGGLSERRPF